MIWLWHNHHYCSEQQLACFLDQA